MVHFILLFSFFDNRYAYMHNRNTRQIKPNIVARSLGGESKVGLNLDRFLKLFAPSTTRNQTIELMEPWLMIQAIASETSPVEIKEFYEFRADNNSSYEEGRLDPLFQH
ncbi:hypothetical protein L9F63_011678, partial [Diploptera punctata]